MRVLLFGATGGSLLSGCLSATPLTEVIAIVRRRSRGAVPVNGVTAGHA